MSRMSLGRTFPKLVVEALEDRTVPAVITVTTLADNVTVDGQVTLREAVNAANTDTSVDGSTAGSGADTIQFAAGLAGGTINLATIGDDSCGPAALGAGSNITIDGLSGGTGITIQRDGAGPSMRLFNVSAGSSLTLTGLTLANGLAAGGDGGGGRTGGGGAAGLGGAIFNSGSLNLVQSTVTGNSAVGGDGGIATGFTTYNFGGGGGGSLGGNGGTGALGAYNTSPGGGGAGTSGDG